MILELFITILGIASTVPGTMSDLQEDFQAGKWETWVKVFPQSFLLLACLFRLFKKLARISLVLSVLGLLSAYFCLLFNSTSSGSAICSEYSSACPSDVEITCTDVSIEPWEALSYMVGLCLLVIGSTILIRDNYIQHRNSKVTPMN